MGNLWTNGRGRGEVRVESDAIADRPQPVSAYSSSEQMRKHDVDHLDALYFAIIAKKVIDVAELLHSCCNVNDQLTGVGTTPLILACEVGDLEIVELLIQKHADPTVLDSFGSSALVTASRHGHLGIVKLLLQLGADVNHIAPKEEVPEPIRFELRFNPDLTDDDFREICDPYRGNTALIQACREHHAEVAETLLAVHCDVNTQNLAGNTALHVACFSRTANIHHSDNSCYVPDTIFLGGSLRIVKKLIENGALVNMKNASQDTPLRRSLRGFDPDYSQSLKSWGVPPHDFQRILCENLQIVQELMYAGSDLSPRYLCINARHIVENIVDLHMSFVDYNEVYETLEDTLKLLIILEPHLFQQELLFLMQNSSVQAFANRRVPFRTWLIEKASTPMTLKQLSVVAVRRCLPDPMVPCFAKLPLPTALIEDLWHVKMM